MNKKIPIKLKPHHPVPPPAPRPVFAGWSLTILPPVPCSLKAPGDHRNDLEKPPSHETVCLDLQGGAGSLQTPPFLQEGAVGLQLLAPSCAGSEAEPRALLPLL